MNIKSDICPSSELVHIVIAGDTNSGKSSLLNNIAGCNKAAVSHLAGTTTDCVSVRFELIPYGPVIFTDTAGLDDKSELSDIRKKIALEKIESCDLVLFVRKVKRKMSESEIALLNNLKEKKIPFLTVETFCDKVPQGFLDAAEKEKNDNCIFLDNNNFEAKREILLNKIISLLKSVQPEITPVQGLIKKGDFVLLVTPIDMSAPKGRLILPQVETLRDILDYDAAAFVVKPEQLCEYYKNLPRKPDLVITDSQAFKEVAAVLPEEQRLTSFSILFANKKGDIKYFASCIKKMDELPEKPRVLIYECCRHHRKEDDIGTVKIPALFKKMVRSGAVFEFSGKAADGTMQPDKPMRTDGEKGTDGKRPTDCGRQQDGERQTYRECRPDIVIMCGGCMLTRNEFLFQLEKYKGQDIPVINYGMFLAYANGLFPRALDVFNTLL